MEPIVKSQMADLLKDDVLFSNRLSKECIPSVNIKQNENAFKLEVVALGIKKDDFKLTIDKGIMTISGEKETSSEKDIEKYHRKECNFWSFSRQFILPEKVDTTKIEVVRADGTLSVSLPKMKE